MAVETETTVVLGLLATVAALVLPPYLRVYYHWAINGIRYSGADLWFSFDGQITSEKQARVSTRLLIDGVRGKLDIASSQLKASVWDEQAAEALLKVVARRP